MVADHYQARREAAETAARGDVPYRPCPPEMLYLDEAAWEAALAARPTRAFSPSKLPLGPGVTDAGARIGRSFAPGRPRGWDPRARCVLVPRGRAGGVGLPG